ncbi:MAG: flavodoxin domain-containing protein [Devosia sp.]|nr:flavodoxin domain-containing protein [Devosia sp.]
MHVLIAYGTSEGQTRKIAGFFADRLQAAGDAVTLHDVTRLPRDFDVGAFDAAVIAARVHAGSYQRAVANLVRTNLEVLDSMPNAFVSVSLAAAGHVPGDAERTKRYVARLAARTGWSPKQLAHVAGGRKYTAHNALSRWILGMVDRHRYDTAQDHEFTDWTALAAFVDQVRTGFAGGMLGAGDGPLLPDAPQPPAAANDAGP